MATVEEVLAKAKAWEDAGKPENAAKLRAYADTLPKYDAATVEEKASAWEKAGKPEEAAKLRAYAATLPKVEKPKVEKPKVDPAKIDVNAELGREGMRADTPEEDTARRTAEFAKFEEANPVLKGKYSPDTMPKPGDVVAGVGGGGKSGGARYEVQDWNKGDTFGETAIAMTEGPMAAATAFAGGLTGGESPSREFLANDPLTGGLPDFALTGLGGVGDMAGAALSTVGAGISGASGLLSELVPGQSSADERKLAEDMTGMAMFAVPELAGASSIPARVAAAAPKVAPKVAPPVVPKVAGEVAAADRLGIPVMRSDVKPPQTAIGKIMQRVGESIPVAGTAGMRAKQHAARIEAVKSFIGEYVGETILPAIDNVTSSILAKRSEDLTKYTGQKDAVVEKLKGKGAVPVPKVVAEIDKQIAALEAQKLAELKPVIEKLNDFKNSLADQPLDVIEKNRKAVGKAFADPGLASIRDTGEKALSAIYGPLRNDIAAFVKSRGGEGDVTKWNAANTQLAAMAGDLKNNALKRVLMKGEETPETVRSMLFSQKPSDMERLAKNLPEEGKKAARTAIVQEAVAKAGGLENLSAEKFKNALDRLSKQVGVFFKGEDFEAADGLLKALRLTEQAAKAGAAPLTGVQNLPTGVALLVSHLFGGSIPATVGALGTIGGIARLYEATGVRSSLRRLSKAQNPKAQSNILKSLEAALADAGIPATQGAAQSANSDTAPLRRALP